MRTVLTIAGFDPSSGAGITKDLDVFFSLGVHGLSVPTACVVQGPRGVQAVYPTPLEQFSAMLDLLSAGPRVDGVKIGVVWDEPYCERIAAALTSMGRISVVVDPVASAKNAVSLVTGAGLKRLVGDIFPLATVVTPNIDEAAIITGKKINDLEGMKEAAQSIREMGPLAVIVKGGHLEGEPVDVLFDGEEFTLFERRRSERQVHGTGCVFSSALTAFLVQGYPMREAFFAAETFMTAQLKESYKIDEKGYFYSSSASTGTRQADRYEVLAALRKAGERMASLNMVEFIPQVQLNMGYAIRGAQGIEDVAAFPGRIGCHEGRILMKGEPRFGASSHVARMVLAFMEHYPFVRTCANLRFSDAVIGKAREKGLSALSTGRREGRTPLSEKGGKGLDSAIGAVLEGTVRAPDIIYDAGGMGIEPMMGLFAGDPLELIKKMETIRT